MIHFPDTIRKVDHSSFKRNRTMQKIVVPTTYFGPIYLYSKILNAQEIGVEQYDTYMKQTYRNRCTILGANGMLSLSIPVVKTNGTKTLVKDVHIDYSTRWQSNHWRSICSAYNSSPFFEYYSDEFAPFYEKNFKYLIDFNIQILEMILDLLGMKNKSVYTTNAYQKTIEDAIDFRDVITPKKDYLSADPVFVLEPYTQTFDEKMEFVPNLSIVDLLCNKGPEALSYLQRIQK
jgi:hypothetical protein